MDILFAAFSTRYLTVSLSPKIPYQITRRTSRGIRVLWYMREMGGGWLSEADLTRIGAGYWRTMKYILPDLLKDELIDKHQFTKTNGRVVVRYKINQRGIALLDIADSHLQNEYARARSRIQNFKIKYGISANPCSEPSSIS